MELNEVWPQKGQQFKKNNNTTAKASYAGQFFHYEHIFGIFGTPYFLTTD